MRTDTMSPTSEQPTCTLCCTLMRVTMAPPKPERQRCVYCQGHGCTVYESRPEACSGFQCLWLASQQLPEHALPAAMRPDRAGVVLDLNAAGTVIAHCERPASWKRAPMRGWLLGHAQRTNIILELPDGAELLAADVTTERLERVGVDPDTNNRLYVRQSRMPAWQAAQVG